MMDSDEDDLEPPAELPLSERRLVTQSYDLSVSTLVEQWTQNILILPEIQREYVWSNAKASRLIESLLLNVPIPVLYFAEAADEQYEVIDGHQRVKSIARYVNNEFALSGLKVVSADTHRGKRFHQLPTADQRRIRTRVIRAIILTEESHPSMKFEVFERLNSGSTALNAQEIRNSTHRGAFMNLVKSTLVHNSDFRTAIATVKPRSRMVDHELAIRFLAMRDNIDNYRPPLPRFLNKYCTKMNSAGAAALETAQHVFEDATRNVNQLFGANAFRLTDQWGNLIEKPFNTGLAETQLLVFSFAARSDVVRLRGNLLDKLGQLHRDPDFLDDIQRAIVDRNRTLGRMKKYMSACKAAGLAIGRA